MYYRKPNANEEMKKHDQHSDKKAIAINVHSLRGCLTTVLLLTFMHVWGQAIDWDVDYRVGDAMEFLSIDYVNHGWDLGKGAIADMSKVKMSDAGSLILKEAGSDSIASWNGAEKTTYRLSGDTLFLAGHEDRLCAIRYDESEAWLRRGLRKGEVLEGLFHGSGTYCGRLFVRVIGRYRSAIDGGCALVLPDGDTLRNVVRLRTERLTRTITQSLDSITNAVGGEWREPPIPSDGLEALMNEGGPWMKSSICRYYAPGYRYPVL